MKINDVCLSKHFYNSINSNYYTDLLSPPLTHGNAIINGTLILSVYYLHDT
jgi:hypothetical protein